jgi:DnaK suppressor protein
MSNKGTADSSGREYCTAAAGPARWMDGAEGPKRRRRTTGASITSGGSMVTAGVVGVRHAAGTRQEHTAKFSLQFLRMLEELRETHTVHVARIDGENLQDSDPDDELVVRTQSSSRHWLLGEIDDAIGRLGDGTYGECEDCRAAIPRRRLETIPYARRCVACQRGSAG